MRHMSNIENLGTVSNFILSYSFMYHGTFIYHVHLCIIKPSLKALPSFFANIIKNYPHYLGLIKLFLSFSSMNIKLYVSILFQFHINFVQENFFLRV
jgi:hypothetical protein